VYPPPATTSPTERPARPQLELPESAHVLEVMLSVLLVHALVSVKTHHAMMEIPLLVEISASELAPILSAEAQPAQPQLNTSPGRRVSDVPISVCPRDAPRSTPTSGVPVVAQLVPLLEVAVVTLVETSSPNVAVLCTFTLVALVALELSVSEIGVDKDKEAQTEVDLVVVVTTPTFMEVAVEEVTVVSTTLVGN